MTWAELLNESISTEASQSGWTPLYSAPVRHALLSFTPHVMQFNRILHVSAMTVSIATGDVIGQFLHVSSQLHSSPLQWNAVLNVQTLHLTRATFIGI